MLYGKGQEAKAPPFKPPDEGAVFNKTQQSLGNFGTGKTDTMPPAQGTADESQNAQSSSDTVLKLQNAISTFATALIELNMAHKEEGSAILRDGLNAPLSTSKVLKNTFLKGLFDATEITFFDELIKNVIENGRAGYTERSDFRKAVLGLAKKYRSKIQHRSTIFPYDLDGLIERRAQLSQLDRADIGIPYPNHKVFDKFNKAYPDDEFIKVVEGILSSGKRYYSYFLDGAFNDFLDDLFELNERRKEEKLRAHVDTPFSSKESLLYLVRILAVAYNKLSDDFNAIVKASTQSKEDTYLAADAVVSLLQEKLAISQALLSKEQVEVYISNLKVRGLLNSEDGEHSTLNLSGIEEGDSTLPHDLLTGTQSKRIKAAVAAVWEEMKKGDHFTRQVETASHRLLPIVQEEKKQLEKEKSELTQQLVKAESEVHRLQLEKQALNDKNLELACAHEDAEASHHEELQKLQALYKQQLEAQTAALMKIQATMARFDAVQPTGVANSRTLNDQSEAQIRELQQEIERLTEALSKAKMPAKRRIDFGQSREEGKLDPQIKSSARFDYSGGFSSDEEKVDEIVDPKLKGSFTPPEKTGSALTCE